MGGLGGGEGVLVVLGRGGLEGKEGRGREFREGVGDDVNGSVYMIVIPSSSSSNHASSSSAICRGSLLKRVTASPAPCRIPGLCVCVCVCERERERVSIYYIETPASITLRKKKLADSSGPP